MYTYTYLTECCQMTFDLNQGKFVIFLCDKRVIHIGQHFISLDRILAST